MSDEAMLSDYELKVQQQIEQYVDQPIHGLPEIFHIWSHNYILPGLVDVFGVQSVNAFYAEAARESSNDFQSTCRMLSVGCGDGSVEIELAKSLRDQGVSNFQLTAVDLSPVLIERLEQKVQEEGLGGFVVPEIRDLNERRGSDQYEMVMANHSLHHIVDLEGVFGFIKDSLAPSGIFATCDMIGRNGHMRWPESAAVLQSVWPMLSDKQKFHHQLLRHDKERFEDFDCSGEGFEGIRAQDILYLLLNTFEPYKFFGFGGFIDVLVDRGYGHGFDAESEHDRNLICALADINEIMLDSGVITPTSMMAYFTKSQQPERFYRGRSAESSLRMPFAAPEWVNYYDG